MNREELFDGYLNQSLSPEQEAELESLLKTDEGREAFAAYAVETTQLLEAMSLVGGADQGKESVPVPKRMSPFRAALLASAAILVIGVGVIAYLMSLDKPKTKVPRQSPVVANPRESGQTLVVAAREAMLTEGRRLKVGQVFPDDKLSLKQGKVTLQLGNKVQVRIYQKVIIRDLGNDGFRLAHGTVRVDVPKGAEGFTVTTDFGDIVDLGTSFQVIAGEDSCHVSVSQGKVSLSVGNGTEFLAVRHDAVVMAKGGAVCRIHPTFAIGNAVTGSFESPKTVLIPWHAEWRYWDREPQPSLDWAMPSFDDSDWPRGEAELGYGESDEETVIRGGELDAKPICSWFRHQFELKSKLSGELLLAALIDDGALVYLNGRELLRHNLPKGKVTPATYAVRSVHPEGQVAIFRVPANALKVGTNVLAVEVHQWSPKTSDLSFDLTLVAE